MRTVKTVKAIIVIAAGLCAAIALSGLAGCAKDSNKVVIYSTSEDYRIEHFQKMLDEKFPNADVTISYFPTGSLAAKLKAEGAATEADIIGELEAGYLEGVADNLADLSAFDSSPFLPELVPAHHKYLPFYKGSGCVIINTGFLNARGIPAPVSYRDLIDPVYKGVLSMPNPKSSSTGYFFLKGFVNAWGEDAAFAWFDAFAENVLQFTSSGSGPVNALTQGEAGVGLGMTFQAVTAVNSGAPVTITFLDEGSPYSLYGCAIIKDKDKRALVRDVFQFYVTEVNRADKELFAPEQIFKEQANTMPNYPANVRAMDMRGIEDLAEKERLLSKWQY